MTKEQSADFFRNIVNWLEEHEMYYGEDWYWTQPDYAINHKWTYNFTFTRSEHATLFALRWS